MKEIFPGRAIFVKNQKRKNVACILPQPEPHVNLRPSLFGSGIINSHSQDQEGIFMRLFLPYPPNQPGYFVMINPYTRVNRAAASSTAPMMVMVVPREG